MIIVPYGSSPLRREIGRAVRADSGDEPELLLLDHSPHIVCKDAHPSPAFRDESAAISEA